MATVDQQLLSQILDQLGWIRIHLQAMIVVALVFVIAIVTLGRSAARHARGDFAKRGQELLNRERYKELVEQGTRHLGNFPGDANSQWLVAQAHMRLGNLSEALTYAKKAQQLQPDWEAGYTGSFISYLEQELAKSKTKPDLRVVTPNSAPQPDAPPSGGTPVR